MMHSWMLHRGMHGLTIMMQATAKEITIQTPQNKIKPDPKTDWEFLEKKKKKKKKNHKKPCT